MRKKEFLILFLPDKVRERERERDDLLFFTI
ncbi:MAG: hypothetical protein MRERV_1c076 [Mycoplasmataceae bacterium RV_VA103A]|nr:MAG: hypothetical protein MRERV_22c013 [Mycoplasmataceae bacterium RV_VA103A]KLL05396.1 MAG: hypothetical protein MRERV_1c076 [Mycoplasmataceae bacterium RV_VA103A]